MRNGWSARRMLSAAAAAAMIAGGAAAEPVLSGVTLGKQSVAAATGGLDGPAGEALAAFYRERAFAPFWTTGDAAGRARLAGLLGAMARAGDHGLPVDRFDPDVLRARIAGASGPRERGALEVEIGRAFLAYADALSAGVLRPARIAPGVMVRTVERRDPAALLAAAEAGDVGRVLRDLAPRSPEYARLMRQRLELEAVVRAGGWGPAVGGGKLEPGQSGPRVVALRDRLKAMGVLGRSLGATYDAALAEAVRTVQRRAGLEPDGIAGPATLAAIDVPARERLAAVLVAMERERWLSSHQRPGRKIWVNLPEFNTRIIDDGHTVFTTRSVIGDRDEGKETPEFSDVMEFMVINPSWYVPRGIIARSYLPKLQANPYALAHLDIVDRRGRPANRAAGFGRYTARNFPFSMRQAPGPRNALGRVKFMFPNQYAIYLHDTPDKHLFSRDVRDYSSGCVRLAEPFEFAYALLSRQTDDPVGLFQSILRTSAERRVNLDEPVPVHIVYRTAFTDAKGALHVRDDLYGRDAKVWSALRAAGVSIDPLRTAGDLAADESNG